MTELEPVYGRERMHANQVVISSHSSRRDSEPQGGDRMNETVEAGEDIVQAPCTQKLHAYDVPERRSIE